MGDVTGEELYEKFHSILDNLYAKMWSDFDESAPEPPHRLSFQDINSLRREAWNRFAKEIV